MGIYVTRDDLLAVDGSLVWNMAIDKASGQLDKVKIETAIADADAEINSFLARRFHLPLKIKGIPRPLHRVAVSISLYWLSERDNQITDLIQRRYDDALKMLKEIASGARDLGLPKASRPQEADNGKIITVQDNARLFTRNTLRGVL